MTTTSQSKHLRIRNDELFSTDVDMFINNLENQYKVDIRSLPHWKDRIKSLYDVKKELKTKIRNASGRKKCIIEKIYREQYRPSPFELTEELARTAYLWQEIKLSSKKKRTIDIEFLEHIAPSKRKDRESEELLGEESDIRSTAHPNTEDVEPKEEKDKLDPELDIKSESSIKLPVVICTNPHKFLSPLGSHSTPLTYRISEVSSATSPVQIIQAPILNQTKAVQCFPEEIIVCNHELTKEYSIKFTLRNCINEWVLVRFKGLSNYTNIKIIKLSPVIPVKLYPGLSKMYYLRFKLLPHVKEFEDMINFKIGHVSLDTPQEILNIKFNCIFQERRSIFATECVVLPPAYLWQLRGCKYPINNLNIRVEDDYQYHMHIVKRDFNWSVLLNDKSINSLDVQPPTTESLVNRNDDLESQNICSSLKFDQNLTEEVITTEEIVFNILLEIVEGSLQSFFLERTYLYLKPYVDNKVQVSFRKAENIGCHQCYYDLEFYNPIDNDLVMTKTLKILGEILPHPIHIHPIILDMTETPVIFGLCVDYITIINSHKFIPVMIKIKLTTKMNKLFHISPMESLVPAQSKVKFEVRLCPINHSEKDYDHFVHVTIKILIVGDKSVYENVPPFFYEIIIPCASAFKKIYGIEYFDPVLESNDITEMISEIGNEQKIL